MASTTTDIVTRRRDGTTLSEPVAAAETLYGGTLVCRNASGYAVDGEDANNLVFAGIARAAVDNASGSAGDLNVELWEDGVFLVKAIGLTADDVGRECFLLDNQTVALAGGSGLDYHIRVGVIDEVVSATQAWVRLQPGQLRERRLYQVQIDGVNAAAFDLSTAASGLGGSDFYVVDVESVVSYVAADGTLDGLKVVTTDYTLSAGAVSAVGDETANTWLITFYGYLVP